MEEQSSREFASADAAARAQDAAVQEPGFSPEISFHTRRRLQHLQRPTPPHLRPNAPRTSRGRDDHVADCSRSGLTIHEALTLRARRPGNVTKPNRWTMPVMTRRSSLRSGPVWTIGRCGAIAAHGSSLSQKLSATNQALRLKVLNHAAALGSIRYRP